MRTFVHPRRRLIPTSSGRMSLAACGCCCPLDAGTCSARTQKCSGTVRDDGYGARHGVRLLLHVLRGKRGTGECVFFLVHPLTHDAALGMLGRGPRHASANGCSWKNFLSFAPALFALGIWCTSSVVLVSGSHWVLLLSTDFTGDVFFRWCNTWFDSGYMLCNSTLVAMDVFHTFSSLRRTRILKCCSPFCCRTEKRAQSMLLVAVLLGAVRT